MKEKKIVLDLETQNTFDEVGGRFMDRLKVSVTGIYDYSRDKYLTFEENEMVELEEVLKSAGLIIGFNIKRFDFPVLQPYLSISVGELPALDIMEEIIRVTGHRVSLENVAQGTLKKGKTGDGLDAVRFFREGRIEEVKKYCLQDVRLTREIYEYGRSRGEVCFVSKYGGGVRSVPVRF